MGAAEANLRLGVDLGGTKIEAVILQRDGTRTTAPDVVARRRVATQRDEGYDAVLERVATLIADVTREAGVSIPLPIGVGMPGGVTMRTRSGTRAPSSLRLVKNSNTLCLNGRPFHDDLQARVGRAIAFENDANCFALAEAAFGAAREARVAFGVIMGTGVGGGIALRDALGVRTWGGAQGIAGEWGHVVLEPRDGAPCYCGRRGCVETFLSGPAIERAYAARSGVTRTLRELASAQLDDPHAQATLDEVVEVFGRALAIVIDVLDPDVVVLGGGVSNLAVLYDRGIDAVRRSIFNDELRTKIVRNELGDSAGVFGAALLTP